MSSDNYLRLSKVEFDNADELIKQVMGVGGSFSDRMYSNYGKPIEQQFTEWSKTLFKKLHLGHWSQTTQVGLLMLVTMLPFCFLITVLFAKILISIYNWTQKSLYDRKMKQLTDRRNELQEELSKI